MKTCKEIEREFSEAYHVLYERRRVEMLAAKVREFPIGTEVTWRHGLLTVKGKVTRVPDYLDDAVCVKRHGAKNEQQKAAQHLTRVGV
jgi:hypothetical protein